MPHLLAAYIEQSTQGEKVGYALEGAFIFMMSGSIDDAKDTSIVSAAVVKDNERTVRYSRNRWCQEEGYARRVVMLYRRSEVVLHIESNGYLLPFISGSVQGLR